MNVDHPLFYLIQGRSGIVLDHHKRADVQREVDLLLAENAFASAEDLHGYMVDAPFTDPVWQRLVIPITIGETYFFRNQAHFAALRHHLLPNLIEKRRKTGFHQLRIWSAGCATGEEPYSVAMLVRELLPDWHQWMVTILATDINNQFLNRAREGLYSERSFRGETPDWLRDRWFTPVGRHYQLADDIRRMVRFMPLNLLGDDYPAYDNNTMNMDIIFCRNVTIYFDRDTTGQIVSRFHQALNEDGWLIVGHSEPQAVVYEAFTPRNFERAVFYQKSGENAFARMLTEVAAPPPEVHIPPPPPPRPPIQVEMRQPAIDYWMQAKAAANVEQWEMALEWLAKADDDDMLQPHVHYLRGLIRMQMEDLAGAIVSLRQAIYCDPGFALAHYTLGDLHARRGADREALRHWRRAQKALDGLDPEMPIPYAEGDLTVEMLSSLLKYRIER